MNFNKLTVTPIDASKIARSPTKESSDGKDIMKYTLRIKSVGNWGIFLSDNWEDHVIESPLDIQALARKLASEGFRRTPGKWIMPASILWIKEQ